MVRTAKSAPYLGNVGKDFPPDPACERLREDNIIYSRYLTEDAG